MSIRAHTTAQRLTERVRFERPLLDANGDAAGWSPLGSSTSYAAAIDGEMANERSVADGQRSVGGYTVWIRADVFQRLQLAVNDRAVWLRPNRAAVYLDIKSAADQGLRGRMIPLVCEAGVNKG